MNPHPEKSAPAADALAALWAARLDGSVLTAADRRALDAWLAADPAHRGLLSAYCQFSADLEQQLPLLAGIPDTPVETNRELTTARPRPGLFRPMWVGAMLTAAAAAVAFVLWSGRVPTQNADFATPAGQRQEFTLVDGTRVELNAGTHLSVALERGERHVRLTAGQAFFAVAKDASRPFFVETPAGTVRVTGTQFDVNARTPATLEVTVLEGSVQVRTGAAAPVALKPGDQFSGGAINALSDRQLDDALAWRKGQVVFKGTPLREAVARFARHHGRTIDVDDSAAGIAVGGRFSLDDLDGFLALLAEGYPVTLTRDAQGNVHVSRRTQR